MRSISEKLKSLLFDEGADLVGIGELSEVEDNARCHMPFGVCVAVVYPRNIIKQILDMPTEEYLQHYNTLNEQLDTLVIKGADLLKNYGYSAIPQTREYVRQFQTEISSRLPHKTIATRSGLGWIGKCALLITEQYGSMVRISTILTDAPLVPDEPINASKCGDCRKCTDACPGNAVSGKQWRLGSFDDNFFDAKACRKTARERSLQSLKKEISLCGKCIAVCPFTQKYLNQKA